MQINLKIPTLALVAILAMTLLANSCKKNNDPSVATITTVAAADIDIITASSGGTITADGGAEITERGVCWGTVTMPVVTDNKTSDGEGVGTFTSSLTGLEPNTIYYVRAYATNSAGTAYGAEITFTTEDGVVDADGNAYHIASITSNGITKTFMTENLRTTKYNDGTDIPLVANATTWAGLTTPGYCWYNNDLTTYGNTYGALYNWYTVNTGKLAPSGWHVTTRAEWTALITFLGGEDVAGGKLKETGTEHWLSPNTDASNTIGFNGLAGGDRGSNGSFYNYGEFSFWWTSTEDASGYGYYYYINYNSSKTYEMLSDSYKYGLSVRLIKD
jgi:uncharacterized protein (TIGR02145 family)